MPIIAEIHKSLLTVPYSDHQLETEKIHDDLKISNDYSKFNNTDNRPGASMRRCRQNCEAEKHYEISISMTEQQSTNFGNCVRL